MAGAGKHVWAVTLDDLTLIFKVRHHLSIQCGNSPPPCVGTCETETINGRADLGDAVGPDSLLVHLRLRGGLRGHQDLAPLLLPSHLPRQRPDLQGVPGLRLLPLRLVPDHHLGDHGELLQAHLVLLEPVQRRRGHVHRHQAVLPRARHHQHDQRRHHPVDPHPADPEAADVGEEEGGRHWNPAARRLVWTLSSSDRLPPSRTHLPAELGSLG